MNLIHAHLIFKKSHVGSTQVSFAGILVFVKESRKGAGKQCAMEVFLGMGSLDEMLYFCISAFCGSKRQMPPTITIACQIRNAHLGSSIGRPKNGCHFQQQGQTHRRGEEERERELSKRI